jgi:Tfp pilus assembly protein PilF
MSPAVRKRTTLLAVGIGALVLAAVIGLLLVRRAPTISPDSPAYEEMSRAFYHGLAALEVGLLDDARTQFTRATEIVPSEPAAWANLGLTRLRLGETDLASAAIERAATLAPSSSAVAYLQGQLEMFRGRPDAAIVRFRRAVELDPRGLRVRYALEQEIESAGGPGADAQAQDLFDELLALDPDNVAMLLERARLAAKRADAPSLQDSVARLAQQTAGWTDVAREQFGALEQASAQADFAGAARTIPVLRNVLLRVPSFREDLIALRTPGELIAEPFDRFLSLPVSTSRPSPPDTGLAFSRESPGPGRPDPLTALLAFSRDGIEAPIMVGANGQSIADLSVPESLAPFPSGTAAVPPSASGLLPMDWNRDFRVDLVLAGGGGVRLLAQDEDGRFREQTYDSEITTPASGVWAADVEMDGDLDVVVGVDAGAPVVLRNNGDGSWQQQRPFGDLNGVRGFSWADLDEDGDPDAALLDEQGVLHLFANRQGGQFAPMAGPDQRTGIRAVVLGDVNGDRTLDVVTIDGGGAIRRASYARDAWDEETLTSWSGVPDGAAAGALRLFIEDLDNNGSADLVASGGGRSQIWLSDAEGGLIALAASPESDVFGITDLDGDGMLDLVGLSNGQAERWLGRGTKGYHWQVFRPRAQMMAGDQRINTFGIGGRMEIRSGLLTEAQVIARPIVHFGLGARTAIDVSRIVWPNGVAQADFDASVDRTVVAEQRLKGSCPWVFTYDGSGMRFVTDFLWRSPLGLRINAQDTAGISQTEDWVKIRGDQLKPRDGSYDVRITAELWETHFVDTVSLMAVDHPAGMDVFVDERFAKEPPALGVHAVAPPRPVVSASDDAGEDVTDLVSRQDGRYLATFERGIYQGVAHDHFVELDLGREISDDAPLWLVASGWIYPTDSSINVAIGQGSKVQPRGLSLEAQDASGRWVLVSPDLGFPAGKNKTILVDLTEVVRAGVAGAHRLRLRTNLEIYWDWIASADAAPNGPMRTTRIAAGRADLRYRGFSKTDFSRRDAPEIPDYGELANVVPRWRDLVGYYTRFGDVRELLEGVDDRYVIMNAGDELQMTFPAPPEPPDGWVRDFVLMGDGWVKDGDFNTSYSKTVLPLPSHDRPDYVLESSSLELEDDPVYRRHPLDWQTYHTRFVTPRTFVEGLP